MNRSGQNAFTLVELLVTVSLVGVLATTSLGSMSVYKSTAYRALISSQAHSIALAATVIRGDMPAVTLVGHGEGYYATYSPEGGFTESFVNYTSSIASYRSLLFAQGSVYNEMRWGVVVYPAPGPGSTAIPLESNAYGGISICHEKLKHVQADINLQSPGEIIWFEGDEYCMWSD